MASEKEPGQRAYEVWVATQGYSSTWGDYVRDEARAAWAHVEREITNEALRRAAEVAEAHEWFVGGIGTTSPGSAEAKAIAATILALIKEPGHAD